MTFGSLFSGIGGMDLGLEQAGWRCAWQCELDPWRRSILEKHWPEVPKHEDVQELARNPGILSRVDLVAGGDPCQANSLAGSGLRDSHDATVADSFLAIVDALRPRFVLRENPPARRDAPWPWWRFRSCLEALGYAVLPFRLRACCLGALHRRERVFLLGELADHAEAGRRTWRNGPGDQAGARTIGCPRGPSGGRPAPHPDGEELRAEQGRSESRGTGAAEPGEQWEAGATADAAVTRQGHDQSASQGERVDREHEGSSPHPDRGRQLQQSGAERAERGWAGDGACPDEPEGTLTPVLVRGVHGVPCRTHRAKRIAALGDSVTPPQARFIGELLMEACSC